MARPRLTRGPVEPVTTKCLCGALAIERTEAGRWFCADHVPRPQEPPRPPARKPEPPPPRQGRLFS